MTTAAAAKPATVSHRSAKASHHGPSSEMVDGQDDGDGQQHGDTAGDRDRPGVDLSPPVRLVHQPQPQGGRADQAASAAGRRTAPTPKTTTSGKASWHKLTSRSLTGHGQSTLAPREREQGTIFQEHGCPLVNEIDANHEPPGRTRCGSPSRRARPAGRS